MKRIKKIFYVALCSIPFSNIHINIQAAEMNSVLSGITGFEENLESVPPVNPENPEEEIETNGKIPTAGPLSISYISDIEFGSHPQSLKDVRLNAELTKITNISKSETRESPNFIQLTDNRGKNSGWKLKVRQDAPLTNTEGFALKNTVIDFQNIQVFSLHDIIDKPSKIVEHIELNGESQEEKVVVEAEKNTGMGSWMIQFGEDLESGKTSIGLFIPGKTEKKAGVYTTSLTWSLQDAP